MSVTLLLIPALLAAAAGGGAAIAGATSLRGNDERVEAAGPAAAVAVRTRMKDGALLARAIESIGGTGVSLEGESVSARIGEHLLQMDRSEDGLWQARIERGDGVEVEAAEAEALILQIDGAYARSVQQAVAERIRQRADSSGFELVSETNESDDTITMVLTVQNGH